MPGRMHCGELHVWPIAKGLEPPLRMRTLQPADVRDLLPRRAADAHKGDCGRVELLAGSAGMAGAGILCARSALCAGRGSVTLHADPALESVYQQAVPQAMYAPQQGDAPPPAPGGRGVAAIGPGRGEHAADPFANPFAVRPAGCPGGGGCDRLQRPLYPRIHPQIAGSLYFYAAWGRWRG